MNTVKQSAKAIALLSTFLVIGSASLLAQRTLSTGEITGPEAEALSALRYRNIGPANMGGRVSSVAGIPGNSKTWWFGGADGGLWMTKNGGTTFQGQWQDEQAYSVGSISVAPSDHNVLYLGSGEADPRNSISYGLGAGVFLTLSNLLLLESLTHINLRKTMKTY